MGHPEPKAKDPFIDGAQNDSYFLAASRIVLPLVGHIGLSIAGTVGGVAVAGAFATQLGIPLAIAAVAIGAGVGGALGEAGAELLFDPGDRLQWGAILATGVLSAVTVGAGGVVSAASRGAIQGGSRLVGVARVMTASERAGMAALGQRAAVNAGQGLVYRGVESLVDGRDLSHLLSPKELLIDLVMGEAFFRVGARVMNRKLDAAEHAAQESARRALLEQRQAPPGWHDWPGAEKLLQPVPSLVDDAPAIAEIQRSEVEVARTADMRGRLLMAMGQFEEAAQMFEKAGLPEASAAARMIWGLQLSRSGETARAGRILRGALKSHPKVAEGIERAARGRLSDGLNDLAIPVLSRHLGVSSPTTDRFEALREARLLYSVLGKRREVMVAARGLRMVGQKKGTTPKRLMLFLGDGFTVVQCHLEAARWYGTAGQLRKKAEALVRWVVSSIDDPSVTREIRQDLVLQQLHEADRSGVTLLRTRLRSTLEANRVLVRRRQLNEALSRTERVAALALGAEGVWNAERTLARSFQVLNRRALELAANVCMRLGRYADAGTYFRAVGNARGEARARAKMI